MVPRVGMQLFLSKTATTKEGERETEREGACQEHASEANLTTD
jgi:hypothetical protein